MCLKRNVLFVFWAGDTVQNRFKQGLEILGRKLAVTGVFQRAHASLGGRVNNGHIEQRINIGFNTVIQQIFTQRQ